MMTSHHFCHLVKLITELKRITSRNELVIHTLIYIENSLEGGTGKVGTIWASLFLLLMWLHGVNLLFFCFEKKKKTLCWQCYKITSAKLCLPPQSYLWKSDLDLSQTDNTRDAMTSVTWRSHRASVVVSGHFMLVNLAVFTSLCVLIWLLPFHCSRLIASINTATHIYLSIFVLTVQNAIFMVTAVHYLYFQYKSSKKTNIVCRTE